MASLAKSLWVRILDKGQILAVLSFLGTLFVAIGTFIHNRILDPIYDIEINSKHLIHLENEVERIREQSSIVKIEVEGLKNETITLEVTVRDLDKGLTTAIDTLLRILEQREGRYQEN